MYSVNRRIRRKDIAKKNDEIQELAKLCARIADDTKAENTVSLEVTDLIVLTDYFVITNGTNRRQVNAIADEIAVTFKKLKVPCLSREGEHDGSWELLDYGDLVVHIFDKATREFYSLERLWADAPKVRWKKPARKTKTKGDAS